MIGYDLYKENEVFIRKSHLELESLNQLQNNAAWQKQLVSLLCNQNLYVTTTYLLTYLLSHRHDH